MDFFEQQGYETMNPGWPGDSDTVAGCRNNPLKASFPVGEKDHIAPPILGQTSLKKYNSSVNTEFKLFESRGHSLIVDHGWREVAEYSGQWLNKNSF